jgi:hypothetical protein
LIYAVLENIPDNLYDLPAGVQRVVLYDVESNLPKVYWRSEDLRVELTQKLTKMGLKVVFLPEFETKINLKIKTTDSTIVIDNRKPLSRIKSNPDKFNLICAENNIQGLFNCYLYYDSVNGPKLTMSILHPGSKNLLWMKKIDLSEDVQGIKNTNTLQDLKLIGHGLNISANTDAIVATDTLLGTTVATTGSNTLAIVGITSALGLPATGITPSTGIYGSIDSKTSRALFGSGNVAIYGAGLSEYINVVYNNSHFEDVVGINNKVFNLKEPYKSLPTTLNNLSDVVSTKQNIFTCISPLIKTMFQII